MAMHEALKNIVSKLYIYATEFVPIETESRLKFTIISIFRSLEWFDRGLVSIKFVGVEKTS